MRVYLVNAGDDYYPIEDNTKKVFTDKGKAEAYAAELREELVSYPWAWVEIFEHEVELWSTILGKSFMMSLVY